MINYTNWKSYYKNTHINDYNLKESEHVKLFNTNDLTYKEDNINHMNPYLGEMPMLYYIWKNQIKSDYIIISQYRRDFYNINFDELQKNKVQVLMKGYNKLSIHTSDEKYWESKLFYKAKGFIEVEPNILKRDI